MNGYDAVQFVILKLNVIITSITNNIIDALKLLLLVKATHILYSMHYCGTIFWVLSFKSTLLVQDCAKQSFVGTNLWAANKATFNIFQSIHMSLIMMEITVQHNDKIVLFLFQLFSALYHLYVYDLHCNNMWKWNQEKHGNQAHFVIFKIFVVWICDISSFIVLLRILFSFWIFLLFFLLCLHVNHNVNTFSTFLLFFVQAPLIAIEKQYAHLTIVLWDCLRCVAQCDR